MNKNCEPLKASDRQAPEIIVYDDPAKRKKVIFAVRRNTASFALSSPANSMKRLVHFRTLSRHYPGLAPG